MKCPKCEAEIKRFDLSPNCKKCGVHIMYYTQEEDLARDAKKTELEFASARLLAAKCKTAFIGGKVQTSRLVLLLLCIAVLVLPSYNVALSFPWWEYEISVGALGIYNIISDSFWQLFDNIHALGAFDALFSITIASFCTLLGAAIATVVAAGFLLFSFLDVKATAKGCAAASAAGILFHCAGSVLMFIATSLSGGYEFISAKPMYGSLAGIVVLGAFLALNVMLAVNTPSLQLREADKKRLEVKKQLKSGKLTLDELPLPIVKEDTAEKEKKSFGKNRKSAKKGGNRK